MKILESLIYTGPNRRANVCLIENLFELNDTEQRYILDNTAEFLQRTQKILDASGLKTDIRLLSDIKGTETALDFFARLYAGVAIAVQRASRHRVQFLGNAPDFGENRVRSLFEYEQGDVGNRADGLAGNLLQLVMPELDWDESGSISSEAFARSFAEFREFARPFRLPPDTQAIINAAARLDIPCVKLERDPYQGPKSQFRIRRNSMLKLGHSAYQHIVDGTFCVDKGHRLLPLLGNRQKLFQFLNDLKITDESLRGAIKWAHQVSNDVKLEEQLTGETYRFVVANGELIGVLATKTEPGISLDVHEETLHVILGLARILGTGLLVADIKTQDIRRPLSETDGAIVNLDLSPELDSFLPANSEMHQRAMTAFVKWLYPEGSRSRIPLICVTGTNGKSTTCRMISKIMQAAEYHPGLACSDGVYVNGELQEAGDCSGQNGHHRVLESRNVDVGVLETARGAVAHSGFMFDWCDVAVCLNVTMDHLGEYGIYTLEQMATLKRSVLERARKGIVLNADDKHCVGMLPFLAKRRTCLVSIASRIEDLRSRFSDVSCFGAIEEIDGSAWLVLYDSDSRTPVIAAVEIPATFEGKALYNVSNALHALAACYLMDVDVETIGEGLRKFEISFETSPGRLNFYDEHPFRVLLDYAHNADGFSVLGNFVDQLDVQGKKVLMLQARGDYGDEFILQIATAAAGHFDHYVCRSHPVYPGPDAERSAALMKQGLLDAGVAETQVTTTTDPAFALETTLGMGSEGDLLVLAPGEGQREETWERIISW